MDRLITSDDKRGAVGEHQQTSGLEANVAPCHEKRKKKMMMMEKKKKKAMKIKKTKKRKVEDEDRWIVYHLEKS